MLTFSEPIMTTTMKYYSKYFRDVVCLTLLFLIKIIIIDNDLVESELQYNSIHNNSSLKGVYHEQNN